MYKNWKLTEFRFNKPSRQELEKKWCMYQGFQFLLLNVYYNNDFLIQ